MKSKHNLSAWMLLAACLASPPCIAHSALYINELFFDPGGEGSDLRDEYIELRGAPGMPLANHYLVFLENENNEDNTGTPGVVENIFDLNSNPADPQAGQSMGSNGFLTLRQRNNSYSVAPGTRDLANSGAAAGLGWGSGDNSLVGHTAINNGIVIENSGFTAMLIRVNDGGPLPVLGMELDAHVDNDGNPETIFDGLDYPNGVPDLPNGDPAWTILDSIGVFSETGEAYYGRTYAKINFGPEIVGEPIFPGGPILESPNVEPDAVYVGAGYEIEYVGRWGNSTGQAAGDWHASNLTDNAGSGSAGVPDWRQSCLDVAGDCHPAGDGDPNTPAPQFGPTESTQGVPYGAKLADTLGAPNYRTGDFNGDGVVDAADYIVWRKTRNQAGNESSHPAADANHDFLVDAADHAKWMQHFGQPYSSGAGAGTNVGHFAYSAPEPAGWLSALLAGVTLLRPRYARRGPSSQNRQGARLSP